MRFNYQYNHVLLLKVCVHESSDRSPSAGTTTEHLSDISEEIRTAITGTR